MTRFFDSERTTNIFHDCLKYVTLESFSNPIITGVAGEIPVLGQGKVKAGNMLFYNVAHFSSMHFDLISTKCALSALGCHFIFDNKCSPYCLQLF